MLAQCQVPLWTLENLIMLNMRHGNGCAEFGLVESNSLLPVLERADSEHGRLVH